METTWLDIIDAAYRMDGGDDVWLSQVREAAKPLMSHGLGTVAVLYDASEPGAFQAHHISFEGLPPFVTADMCREHLAVGQGGAQLVQELFGRVQCGLVSETFAACFPALLPYTSEKNASPDMLAVNGTDPTLVGCILTANRPDSTPIEAGAQLFWQRLSAHIAAAYRLRRRLREQTKALVDCADAVLTPDARLLHAAEQARATELLELLRSTARVQERLRVRKHRGDPDAVGDWKAMVDARWSLVQHVENDGKRLILAHANESTKPEPELSTREREVLAFAALGHSNKMIAYELGLAHSTVRVLLTRAATKLGARGRDAAIAQFRRRTKSDR